MKPTNYPIFRPLLLPALVLFVLGAFLSQAFGEEGTLKDCAAITPGLPAEQMLDAVLKNASSEDRAGALRLLPRLNRRQAQELALEFLTSEGILNLKIELVNGMGESANKAYGTALIQEFPAAPSNMKFAIAHALGNISHSDSLTLYKNYLGNGIQRRTDPSLTEEIILALGRLKTETNNSDVLLPLVDEPLHSAEEMALRFSHDPEKDRMFGALAWALDDMLGSATKDTLLGLPPGSKVNFRDWVQNLYKSQSRFASVRAAKVLLKNSLEPADKNLPAPSQYLTDLLNNKNLGRDVRILAGQALVANYGPKRLSTLNQGNLDTTMVYLTLLREAPHAQFGEAQITSLLNFPDAAVRTEGALAAADFYRGKKKRAVLDKIQEKYEVEKSAATRAALRYACEDIISSVAF